MDTSRIREAVSQEDTLIINESEAIDRFSDAYQQLARDGLFAGRLQGSYQIPREAWEMTFMMLRDTDKEAAKAIALAYLSAEFDAKGVQFFRDGASQVKFIARFYRGDC